MNINLDLHHPADCLPDADTDVLVLARGDTEMQLGALIGNEPPEWVDAQGESLRVVAWAEMPRVSAQQPRTFQTITGQRIDLAEPWRVPNVRVEAPSPAPRSSDDEPK